MALAKLSNGIDELHGAIDSVKEGQRKRARLVCRWRPQGPQKYAEYKATFPPGSKQYKHFHFVLYLLLLRLLQSLQSIWQLSGVVCPPCDQGVIWSASISSISKCLPQIGQIPFCFSYWRRLVLPSNARICKCRSSASKTYQ